MQLYLAVALAVAALLVAASGVAAIARRRVLPVNRRPVHRPRLHGWGQVTVAAGLLAQALFGLPNGDIGTRQWGTLTGSALLLAGVVTIAISHRPGGDRRQQDTPPAVGPR
ncbi:hypothetical protein ACF065_18365 [Streptomyces sp. NPDC015232]|uniref:hypothetical protein n=1 Tax=unclassified Streptomyces TaxID=2593676 RepID=UPI0036FD51F8